MSSGVGPATISLPVTPQQSGPLPALDVVTPRLSSMMVQGAPFGQVSRPPTLLHECLRCEVSP